MDSLTNIFAVRDPLYAVLAVAAALLAARLAGRVLFYVALAAAAAVVLAELKWVN